MPFPADESKLVSIFVQTLLYGAYTVLFAMTYWVLVHRRPRGRPIHKTMLGISITMFILATMHIAVNYTRILKAFIQHRDAPGGPASFFNQLSEFTQIFGSTIYVAQTLLGDAVVLLRCYLVWGRRLSVVAFPCLLLLGSTVTGIGILYSFAKVVPEAEIFVKELQEWIVSFFTMTFATNVICTGLVAIRIWYINRQTIVFTGHSMRPVMLLVIESGAVYSATLLVLLILYKVKSWFQYVLLDAVSPIVGLVFSMIIIRIGLGITTIGGATAALPSLSTGPHSFIPGTDSHSHPSDTDSHLTKRVGGAGVGHIQLGPFKAAPNASLTFDTSVTHSVTSKDVEKDGEDVEADRNSPKMALMDVHVHAQPRSRADENV